MKRCVIVIVLANPKPLTGLYHHTAAPCWNTASQHMEACYYDGLPEVFVQTCVSVIVYCHVWMCPCCWNSVLKPTARSLVSGRYRGTVERRPIPQPQTMSNKKQAGFTRYTHAYCQHICSTAYGPVKCPSSSTGQLKKAENMSGLHTQQFSEMRDRAICCHNYNSRTLCGHSYIEGTLNRSSAVELHSDNTYNSQYGQKIHI